MKSPELHSAPVSHQYSGFLSARTKPYISFTYQSTASPSSFLHDIVVAFRIPKRPRKNKARGVLRSLAVIFYLAPLFHGTAGNFPHGSWSLSFKSLRLCWLWHLIPFASAICCLGIFRMGRIPCNCVILSQHASVTLNAFVLNCWLLNSLQRHQKVLARKKGCIVNSWE